jgi:tol-pal system protein YbgF
MPVPAGDIDAQGASAPRSNLDYKQLYQAAVDQVQRKNYGAARSQFEAFLKAYPGTDLSDNAQFWIGECYFAQGHYQRAVLEYDTVRKKYPAGNKVPAALWKMSLAFDKLGNRDVARSFLKELLEKYPDSPEAGLAQEKLNAWR